ncbi:MAG: redoxin domain-containing protein [Halobacteria archaeon]|nr:redoxin domain-containing protein [Halobacteria archaeon]
MELEFEVVELPETDHVDERDQAPDFERPLVNHEYWEDAPLSEIVPTVLVFYTMDGAFPATYIWNEIRDREWEDIDDEVTVVGISISTPYAHKNFIEERGIDYDLFSDPRNEVAREYGVVNDLDGMNGVEEARPSVFVIDEGMEVEYCWVAEEHPEFPPYDEVEEELRGR